jgi:hypothetical protein
MIVNLEYKEANLTYQVNASRTKVEKTLETAKQMQCGSVKKS